VSERTCTEWLIIILIIFGVIHSGNLHMSVLLFVIAILACLAAFALWLTTWV